MYLHFQLGILTVKFTNGNKMDSAEFLVLPSRSSLLLTEFEAASPAATSPSAAISRHKHNLKVTSNFDWYNGKASLKGKVFLAFLEYSTFARYLLEARSTVRVCH